ncbi:MAG: hypothetical protein MJ056_06785 [Akkermansia sp.]|nr:hypothetical protein [Akkermansia sp.]
MKTSVLIQAALCAAAPVLYAQDALLDSLKDMLPDESSTLPQTQGQAMQETKDPGPAADISPAAHPQEYAAFKERLQQEAKDCNYDFMPAMKAILNATNDEFAIDAWMQQAAKEGVAPAMQYIGDKMLSYVTEDEIKGQKGKDAFALLKKAADAGYAPALLNVALARMNGLGTYKDEAQARKDMLAACKDGKFVPRFKWLQLTGRLQGFDSKDKPEVKAEIDRGNHHVVYFLAMQAENLNDQSEWMQKAAKLGNPEAVYALSAACSATMPKESYQLLQEAVKMHSPSAVLLLGNLLTDPKKPDAVKGLDIPYNDQVGRHLIRLAAMSGNPEARYMLGMCYYSGKFGFRKDESRAYRSFEMGTRGGDQLCATAQAVMLLKGMGVQKDEKAALPLILEAANRGVPGGAGAIILMAYVQYKGLGGVPADAYKAKQTLQDAVANNIPEALVYLAYITAKGGANLTADEKESAMYLRMAQQDMKDEAQQLYDDLMKNGWDPEL